MRREEVLWLLERLRAMFLDPRNTSWNCSPQWHQMALMGDFNKSLSLAPWNLISCTSPAQVPPDDLNWIYPGWISARGEMTGKITKVGQQACILPRALWISLNANANWNWNLWMPMWECQCGLTLDLWLFKCPPQMLKMGFPQNGNGEGGKHLMDPNYLTPLRRRKQAQRGLRDGRWGR